MKTQRKWSSNISSKGFVVSLKAWPLQWVYCNSAAEIIPAGRFDLRKDSEIAHTHFFRQSVWEVCFCARVSSPDRIRCFAWPLSSLFSFDLGLSCYQSSPLLLLTPSCTSTSLRGSTSINNLALDCHTLPSACVCVCKGDLFAVHTQKCETCMQAACFVCICVCIYSTFWIHTYSSACVCLFLFTGVGCVVMGQVCVGGV